LTVQSARIREREHRGRKPFSAANLWIDGPKEVRTYSWEAGHLSGASNASVGLCDMKGPTLTWTKEDSTKKGSDKC